MHNNKKYLSIIIAVALIITVFPGCDLLESLDDEAIIVNSINPTTGGRSENVKPRISGVPNIIQRTSTDGDYRVEVTFNEPMAAGTITTTTVYVRDVTAAPTVIPSQSVTYDASRQMAVIEYSSTSVEVELVVENSVTDISGNNLAGLAGNFNTTLDETTAADYRRNLDPYGTSTWAPAFLPTTVSMAVTIPGTTTSTVVLTLNTGTIDANTISDANFTITPAATIGYDESAIAAGTITLTITGMIEHTEHTITFNPAGIAMGAAAATTYPDATTLLESFADFTIFDTDNRNLGNNEIRSDNILMFKTQSSTLTPPTVLAAADQSGGNDQIIRITYSEDMDPASVVNTANYIVVDNTGLEVQVDITPVYQFGVTTLTMVDISTMNYTQADIDKIVIKSDVISVAGENLDGDGDGIQELNSDYDADGDPDDWSIQTGF